VELRIASVEVEERLVKVEVWEAGQLDAPLLAPYYKAAKAVLIVFDPTDAQALEQLQKYREMTHSGQLCVAVAHLKEDQTLQPSQEVLAYCAANHIQVEVANALTDLNVDSLFTDICQKCLPPV
jgi:hypothetical protein